MLFSPGAGVDHPPYIRNLAIILASGCSIIVRSKERDIETMIIYLHIIR